MTYIAWRKGAVVRIPEGWTVFTLPGPYAQSVLCTRQHDGTIACRIEGAWRRI